MGEPPLNGSPPVDGSLLRPCSELMSDVKGCGIWAVPKRRGLTLRLRLKLAAVELIPEATDAGVLDVGGSKVGGGV